MDPMDHPPPSQKWGTHLCAHRGCPTMRNMAKVSFPGCNHPKLVCSPPGMAVPVPWGSKSASTLFTLTPLKATQSLAAEGWGGEVSPPSATAPGRAQWGLGHQGMAGSTSSHSQPEWGPGAGTLSPLTSVRTPVAMVPQESLSLCPTAKGMDGQQGRAQLHPRPRPGCSQIWDKSSRQRVY